MVQRKSVTTKLWQVRNKKPYYFDLKPIFVKQPSTQFSYKIDSLEQSIQLDPIASMDRMRSNFRSDYGDGDFDTDLWTCEGI